MLFNIGSGNGLLPNGTENITWTMMLIVNGALGNKLKQNLNQKLSFNDTHVKWCLQN